MSEFLAVSALVKLFWAGVGFFLFIRALGHFDKKIGWSVRAALHRIHGDPMASAVYLGSRFAGGCILVGMLFG